MGGPSFVSLTFDDGLQCQFEQALPVLDSYGFSATFFIVANADRVLLDGHPHPEWTKTDWNKNDIDRFKRMIQNGHEIGAHSIHHRQPFLENDPKFEAEESKRWIESRLETRVGSYCYPFCHVTASIKNAVVNAAYQQARGGANSGYYPLDRTIDLFNVDCRWIRHGENVAGWIRPHCWHVLMFHGIGTINDGWKPISVGEFNRQMAELAKHRDSGVVKVVTFEEGAIHARTSRRI
jgi:peptidoglycan/xylan/chitin deacetylase (PgdA/CDA1 family)